MTSFFRAAANFVGFSGPATEEDPEFAAKINQFRDHISEIQKVRDALQLYSDAAEAMLAAQVVLGEALDSYYQASAKAVVKSAHAEQGRPHQTPTCHTVAAQYKASAMAMYSQVRPALHEVLVSRCIRPVTFILARVPAVNENIAERKKLISALNDARSHIESQKSYDPKSASVMKHQTRLEEATTQLVSLNQVLTATLEEFSTSRNTMLAQEFAAAVACSFHQAQMLGDHMSLLLPALPQAASSLCLLQAAASSRERRRNGVSIADKAMMTHHLDGGNEVKVVLERGKAAGGRSGGYGLVGSSASNDRRRSLRKLKQQHTDLIVDSSDSADENGTEEYAQPPLDRPPEAAGRTAPPPKPPRKSAS